MPERSNGHAWKACVVARSPWVRIPLSPPIKSMMRLSMAVKQQIMKSYTKNEIIPGYFFSPGFYMAYWESCILKNFDSKTILSHNKFKKHREMWVGAIIAAILTKTTKIHHFIGLPDTEPPDIEVVRLMPCNTPKGKRGTKLERISIEVTRCSLNDGESILGQIIRKNTDTYSQMILIVYVYGDMKIVNFEQIFTKLKNIEIKPAEINVLGQAQSYEGGGFLPKDTFIITQIYPIKNQISINRHDSQAFFREIEVIKKTKRGISTKPINLGIFELLPPKI